MRLTRFIVFLLIFALLASSVPAAQLICAKCKKPIASGSYIKASGKYYHSKHFTCTRCGRAIGNGSYQFHDGQLYDSACYVVMFNPRCAYCGEPIDGKYIEVDQKQYHDSCYLEHVAERCAICGKPIQGPYMYDAYGSKVHAEHMDDAKQCTYCSRIISPASRGGKTYPDGRVVCGICLESVVTSRHEADALMELAREELAKEGIIVNLGKIRYEIISKNKMASLGRHGERSMQGYTSLQQTKTLFGLLKDNEVKIYILENMPKWNFVETAAHELMHVWLGLHDRFETSDQLAEGSCNYAAYLVLKHFVGQSDAVITAMMADKDPVYGEGFRKARAYAESVGTAAWLQYLETNDQPPW